MQENEADDLGWGELTLLFPKEKADVRCWRFCSGRFNEVGRNTHRVVTLSRWL
jgi:hypothetical protein